MLMIFTSTSSPAFSTLRASSTRSWLISEAFSVPVTSGASSITASFGSTSATVPLTMVPRSFMAVKSENGSWSSCFTPREIRSRSGSTDRMTVSISSPLL